MRTLLGRGTTHYKLDAKLESRPEGRLRVASTELVERFQHQSSPSYWHNGNENAA